MAERRPRPAGRVLVIDPGQACLLAHVVTADGTWLFTPGGGVVGNEDAEAAARREVTEETSLRLGRLAGPVLFRRAHFSFLGAQIEARETFWVARISARPPIVASDLDDYEQPLLGDWRWLTAAQLQATDIHVYPRCLPDLLRALADPADPHNPLGPGTPWVEEEVDEEVDADVGEDVAGGGGRGGARVAVRAAVPDWAAL